MLQNDTKNIVAESKANSKNIDWKDATDFDTRYKFIRKFNIKIEDLEIRDKSLQITTRKTLLIYFLILLGLQNFFVFSFVFWAYSQNKLLSLSPITSIIVSGTIVETILVLKIIVSKTFSEIKYELHKS